jgi:hypothetical protein
MALLTLTSKAIASSVIITSSLKVAGSTPGISVSEQTGLLPGATVVGEKKSQVALRPKMGRPPRFGTI